MLCVHSHAILGLCNEVHHGISMFASMSMCDNGVVPERCAESMRMMLMVSHVT